MNTKKSTNTRSTCVVVIALGAAVVSAFTGCGSGNSDSTPDAMTTVPAADAAVGDTWSSFAAEFLNTYCGECHGAGDTLRDYTLLPSVQSEMAKIRCGVSATSLSGCAIPAGQFPIGNGAKPTDLDRQRLVDWIENGSPE
ncbi:MAG: hypothetical protein JKY56_08245 [Kofleriaceae bacterium]|nr:hypothetical protein [Kofleriaceae bacterium]